MLRQLTTCPAWLLVFAVGCTPQVLPAQAPAPAPALPDAPAAPEHGLPVVPFGEAWAPPRLIAGDLAALREALAASEHIHAVVEPRLSSAGQGGLLEPLAPDASWTTSAEQGVLRGTPALTRGSVPDGAAPQYEAEGVSVEGTRETTTLVLVDAPVELQAWRALPAAWAGSCEPIYDALALGQEQSLAYAEPFLDHADTVLRIRFEAGLAGSLEALREAVAGFEETEAPADASAEQRGVHACGHAAFTRVQEAEACVAADGCGLAPRLVLRGGVAVAMPAPPWAPSDCDDRLPIDVEGTLQRVATDAVVATVSQLEPQWVTLADRAGAMGAVYEALEDLCSPRRRRFAPEDLSDARARLAGVERALGSSTLDESGRWQVGVGQLFVPGSGPMTTLATFVPAEGGASQTAVAEAKGVRRFLLSRSLCRSGYGERPLLAAVFPPGATAPSFVGYFYEETLSCADLPLPG